MKHNALISSWPGEVPAILLSCHEENPRGKPGDDE